MENKVKFGQQGSSKKPSNIMSIITSALSGVTGGTMLGSIFGTAGAIIGGIAGIIITGLADYRHQMNLRG